MEQLLRTFFNNSAAGAMAASLDMSSNLSETELKRLARLIFPRTGCRRETFTSASRPAPSCPNNLIDDVVRRLFNLRGVNVDDDRCHRSRRAHSVMVCDPSTDCAVPGYFKEPNSFMKSHG